MKDLTTGKPSKVIIFFAIPIMCGFIFQQLYNLADSKIVSEYVGTDAFAAVGATAVVSNTIISFINGLTQGFAIPIANCFGASDHKKMRKYVAGTLLLTIGVSVILTFFSLFFIGDILRLLATPDDIMQNALDYVHIILLGIVFSSAYNVCANMLRAVGDSKTPLICLITSVFVNIGLDLLFVAVLDGGIKGAAYATIISQEIAAALCIIYLFRKYDILLPKKDEWILDKGQYPNLISTGLSMGLMSCIVNIGSVVLQSAINALGTNIVAAHTAARRMFDILTVTMYSVAVAMTTFVSQNMGAKKTARVKSGVIQAIFIVMCINTVLVFICFIFGPALFRWTASTDTAEVIDNAVMYSRISILFFYVLGPLLVLRCSLQGMGRKIVPVFTSILEMLVKIVSASVLVPAFKYIGVCVTEPISWIIMTIVLAIAFFSTSPEKYIKD